MSMLQWNILSVRGNANEVPWLFRFHLEAGGYVLQVTDLARLWTERTPRRELIRRALNSECSIDPSQDDDQREALLNHLRKALLGFNNKCSVHEASDRLSIEISCDLPAGLQPLAWEFDARQQPPTDFRDSFVLPLVRLLSNRRAVNDHLTHLLHDKDNAIDSLLDKFESSGFELNTLFPTASGNRLGPKADKKGHLRSTVKGLKRHELDACSEEDMLQNSPSEDLQQLLQSAISAGSPRVDASGPAQGHAMQGSSDATHEVQGNDKGHGNDQKSKAGSIMSPAKTRPINSGTSAPTAPSPDMADDTTEDEDDLDGPGPEKKSASPPAASTNHDESTGHTSAATSPMPKVSRFGMIGGKNRSTTTKNAHGNATPLAPTPTPTSANDNAEDLEPKVLPKPKSKLGAIGGRKKPQSAVPEKETDADHAVPSAEVETEGTSTDLGRPPLSRSMNDGDTTRRKEPSQQQGEPTLDNPAPSKRQKLKHELEVQDKANDKKKRKF